MNARKMPSAARRPVFQYFAAGKFQNFPGLVIYIIIVITPFRRIPQPLPQLFLAFVIRSACGRHLRKCRTALLEYNLLTAARELTAITGLNTIKPLSARSHPQRVISVLSPCTHDRVLM